MFFPAIEPPDPGVPRRPADHGACPGWSAAEAAAGAGRGGTGRDAVEDAVGAGPRGAVWAAAVAAVRAGLRGAGRAAAEATVVAGPGLLGARGGRQPRPPSAPRRGPAAAPTRAPLD